MLKFDLKKAPPDKTKLVKNLAQGNIIVPYLDRAFNSFDGPLEFKYESKVVDDAWHPSGDCLPSVTALWNKVTNPQHEAISGSLRKTFMVGHYWHQLLQHILVEVLEMVPAESVERSGERGWGALHRVQVLDEVNADYMANAPYHWVRGSADIAPLETKGWVGLVDFKTMSAYQFKQPTLPDWAADKYKCQMNIYMDLFDLDRALIVGINKDSPHDFKEIEFVRDQPLITAIYDKWKYVSELLDHDVEPTEEDDEAFALPLGG